MKSKLTKEEAKKIIVNYFNSKRKYVKDAYEKNIARDIADLDAELIEIDSDEMLIDDITDDTISEYVKKAKFKNSSYIADALQNECDTCYLIPNNVIAARMASIYMSVDDIHLKAFMEDAEHKYMWRCGVIDNELYWMKINGNNNIYE